MWLYLQTHLAVRRTFTSGAFYLVLVVSLVFPLGLDPARAPGVAGVWRLGIISAASVAAAFICGTAWAERRRCSVDPLCPRCGVRLDVDALPPSERVECPRCRLRFSGQVYRDAFPRPTDAPRTPNPLHPRA